VSTLHYSALRPDCRPVVREFLLHLVTAQFRRRCNDYDAVSGRGGGQVSGRSVVDIIAGWRAGGKAVDTGHWTGRVR